ncbi:MAG: hypothetical protein HWN81_04430 [Candidatus Lokiarchaeota archaeon]|nr:hypothetical protein [Candidatus Lokiarchaeota archaeon]
MKEIGVIVNSLQEDVNSYNMVNCLNELSKTNRCYLFLLENTKNKLVTHADFSIFQAESLFSFKGHLISTSLFNSQCCLNSLCAFKKYLYLNKLEWMYLQSFNNEQVSNIFLHEEINIISKSSSYSDILTKLFKPTIGTVYNWNPDELLKVIE